MHTQVQAILAGVVEPADAAALLERALAAGKGSDVTQPQTLYYRSHLAEAWRRAGRPEQVVELLQDWFDLLDLGITNWPENDSSQARSDCHAWGCMPEVEIVRSLFGLNPSNQAGKKSASNPTGQAWQRAAILNYHYPVAN